MPFTRYVTRWSVTVDAEEAVRLAQDDGTTDVDVASGLELIHVECGWALWSDGRVTTSQGLPDPCKATRTLAPAAVLLITEVAHAAPPWQPPRLRGGFLALAEVVEITGSELVEQGRADADFLPPELRRVDVRRRDGSTCTWWLVQASHADGYRYDLAERREHLSLSTSPATLPPPRSVSRTLN